MNMKRTVGLILTSLGTCTFVILMNFVEVYRCFQGSAASYIRTLKYFPVWLYILISIVWIVVGIVLIIQGKTRQ